MENKQNISDNANPDSDVKSITDEEFARMFNQYQRINVDEEVVCSGSKRFAKSSKKKTFHTNIKVQTNGIHDLTFNFRQLNRDIKDFLKSKHDKLVLDSQDPTIRKFQHELAHLYNLKSKSNGISSDRHITLYKTYNSKLPNNFKKLDQLIEKAQKYVDNFENPKQKNKEKRSTIVGQEAKPIETNNVGNCILRKMGWVPGSSLGAGNDSNENTPISVAIRKKKIGLGFKAKN